MKRSIAVFALAAWMSLGSSSRGANALTISGVAAQGLSATNTTTVTIVREGDGVKISFSGTLESAQEASGPWAEVLGAINPFSEALNGGRKFYRTRQPATNSIFSSRSIVDMTVAGPLQEYFDLAFAGMPDGIFPPVRQKPYFEGTVKLAGVEIPADLRVRGNSSLQECPFPKLKFKVSSENRAGTPFFDAREIKIGTHCAEGGSGNVGRLRDERAAFREALAYEIMELMGYIGPRVRRARIEYRNIPSNNGAMEEPWVVARQAMILDDVEVVAERLGGRALDDAEISALTKAGFDEQLVAELELFHALIGNWDYKLSTDGQGLWNTEVIELPNDQLAPIAGDFDLASFVTGVVRSSAPRDYRPELPDVEREALYEVEQIRQRLSAPSFVAASDRFARHRAVIELQINEAEIDAPGRTNALRHMTAFYDALEAVKL